MERIGIESTPPNIEKTQGLGQLDLMPVGPLGVPVGSFTLVIPNAAGKAIPAEDLVLAKAQPPMSARTEAPQVSAASTRNQRLGKRPEEEEDQARNSDDEVREAQADAALSGDGAAHDSAQLVAQANTAAPDSTPAAASAGSGATTGAAVVGTAAAGTTSLGAILGLALGGLALAGGGGGSGSGGDGSGSVSPPADTTAPTLESATADSATKTVTLVFSEALDSTNLPPAGAFSVLVNGVANPVSSLQVTGSTIVLTLQNAFAPSSTVQLTYTDPTGVNEANAIQDLAGNDAATFSFAVAVVADGYVRGAQVFVDTNRNGVVDAGVDVPLGTTDENGNFFLPPNAPAGPILAVGGVNIDTGVPNTISLKAPEGSTVINPLTTLVQGLLEQPDNTLDVTSAITQVASALGLPTTIDLTTFDPIAAASSTDQAAADEALAVQIVAAKVATLVALAASAPADGTTSDEAAAAVLNNLVQVVSEATAEAPVEWTDTTVVETLLGTSSTVVASEVTDSLTTIASATSISEVSTAQAVALDTTPPAAPTSIALDAASDAGTLGDNLTSDSTPTLRLALNTLSTDGTAAVAGNILNVSIPGIELSPYALTVTDIANGFVLLTLPALSSGTYTASATLTDLVPNTSTNPRTYTFTVDSVQPTVSITDNKDGVVNASGGDITYTFTFSETVTGFTADDVVVVNGTKGAFAGSGTTYTLVVTPAAGFEGNVTVDVAAGAASDAAGNGNTVALQSVQAVDTLAPTVAITDNREAVTNGEITYTFTFSEAVSGFTAEDVVVVNGTKGTFTAVSSTVYTLVVTPEAGVEGNVTVDVAAGVASDLASNGNTVATQSVQAVDTQLPTLAITDDKEGVVNAIGGDITYTFTFSEAVSGFTAEDVVVVNGTKGTFAGSGTTYTLVVTPAADTEGNLTVSVAANVATDAAGNGNTEATQSVQTLDTLAPTVTVTVLGAEDNVPVEDAVILSSQASTNDNTPRLFGELSQSIGDGDKVVVFNGTERLGLAELTVSPGEVEETTVYGWSFEPSEGLANGTYNFQVAVEDAAGNLGALSQPFALTINATPPSATATITGVADDVGVITGNVTDGSVTDDRDLRITGSIQGDLAEGDKVKVFSGSNLIGQATVSGGTWSLQTGTLSSDAYSFRAVVESAEGTRGTFSSTYAIALDTTPPGLPVITSVTTGSGSTSENRLTSDDTPVLTVTAEAGLTLGLGRAGQALDPSWYTVVESTQSPGTYTITVTKPDGLDDGGYGVFARDAAGNVTAPSGPGTASFTIDTAPPSAAQIVSIADNSGSTEDRITNDNTPVLTVTAEAGARLYVGTGGQGLPDSAYTVVESTQNPGTYTITFNQPLADNGYGIVVVDRAGNRGPNNVPGGLDTFLVDTAAPTLATQSAVVAQAGSDGTYDQGDILVLSLSEPVAVSSFTLDAIALPEGASFGTGATLSALNPSMDGLASQFQLVLGASPVLDSTDSLTIQPSALVDRAGNANVGALTISAPEVPTTQTFFFEKFDETLSAELEGLSGYQQPWFEKYEVSRFKTAAVEFESFDGVAPTLLRVLDLETGRVLAGRELTENEFFMRSEGKDPIFHIGENGENGLLAVKSYDFSLQATNESVSATPLSTVSFTVPPEIDALDITLNQYVAAAGSAPAYFIVSVFDSNSSSSSPAVFSATAGGTLTEVALPADDFEWIGNGFTDSLGQLWISTYAGMGNQYWTLGSGGWSSADEGDFWDQFDLAFGYDSVVRDGVHALDLLTFAPQGATINTLYDEDGVEALVGGGVLVRAEVYSATVDYEHWFVFKEGVVTAEKAFSTDTGFAQRTVRDPIDDFVYFQILDGSVVRSGSEITSFNQTGGAIVYKVALANIGEVLAAASGANTLVGIPDVTQVAIYTQAQLGLSTPQSGEVAIVDAYIEADTYTGQSDAVVLSGVYNFADDSFNQVASLIAVDGTIVKQTALLGEVDDIVLDPEGANGLFLTTWSDSTGTELAYHFDFTSGQLTNIPTPLFRQIEANGGVPDGVTWRVGNDADNELDFSQQTEPHWIAGGLGNDTITGGSGDDALYGGGGADELRGGAGNDVVSGMGGDDRLRGGAGADTIFGSDGVDRIQYLTSQELTGDRVTGTRTFYSQDFGSGGDRTGQDRIQLLQAGDYDFALADEISYIDRIDVVSGVLTTTQGDFSITLTSSMAASADQNSNGTFGDIRVGGYDGSPLQPGQTAAATTANVTLDASDLLFNQTLVVFGQDGSGLIGTNFASDAFGGMRGNDTIIGGGGNDFIYAGKGADTMTGGFGNDTFGFTAGDSPTLSSINLGSSGVLDSNDTFTFNNGVDRITDFSNGDTVVFAVNTLSTGPTLAAITNGPAPDSGSLAADGGSFALQGSYAYNVFTVDTTGNDVLLVWDGDFTSEVSATGLVFSGVQLDQLNFTQPGQVTFIA